MIDVFETWFNQFTKNEQEKLLKHIRKNHLDMNDKFSTKPSGSINKNLISSSLSSSSQRAYSTSKMVEK